MVRPEEPPCPPAELADTLDRNTLPATAAPGDVPGFELLDVVGSGSTGVVWRAREAELGREVAVKLIAERYAACPAADARFEREARVTARLQHPGIPPVYRLGRGPRGPFLVMKFVRGRTLDALIRAGGPDDPMAVFEAVAHAVGYAHARGVAHCDLKPANVMVGGFGEVQVMDWGHARELAGDAAEAGWAGTPAYMAPEQAAGGAARADERSDVFGLGAILCELLTGEPPFPGPADEALAAAAAGETGPALARLAACGADPAAVDLCARCLSVRPSDRPIEGAQVAAEAIELRLAAARRGRDAEIERASAERGRRRATLAAAVAALVAATLATVAW